MQLIIARPSPFARKVRIVLKEKGLAYSETVDVPWTPGTAVPAHNPLGKVPVLIFADGRRLFDSRVIVEALELMHPQPRLIPQEPEARITTLQVEALADGICDAVVLMVLEAARLEALRSRDWIARQHAKVAAGIGELSRLLGERRHFVGDQLTLADVAAGSALAYADLRLPQLDWRNLYANLVAFSARMEQRPSFAQTKPEAQIIPPVG